MPKLAFDIGVTSLGAGSVTFLVCVLAFARVGNIVAGQPGFDTQAGTTLEFTATRRTPTNWGLDDISPLRPLPSRPGCLAALRNRSLVVEVVQRMGGRVDEGGSLENQIGRFRLAHRRKEIQENESERHFRIYAKSAVFCPFRPVPVVRTTASRRQ